MREFAFAELTQGKTNPLRRKGSALALKGTDRAGLGNEIKQVYRGRGLSPRRKESPPTKLSALAASRVVEMVGGIEDRRLCAEDPRALWRPERSMWFLDRAYWHMSSLCVQKDTL